MDFNLTVQNAEVLVVPLGDNPNGRIVVAVKGDFSAGDVEVGYKDVDSLFTVFVDATSSAEDSYELAIGLQEVFARATGATPDINLRISRVY